MLRLPIVKFFSRILNRATITIVLVALQVLWLLWAFWAFTAGRVWLKEISDTNSITDERSGFFITSGLSSVSNLGKRVIDCYRRSLFCSIIISFWSASCRNGVCHPMPPTRW